MYNKAFVRALMIETLQMFALTICGGFTAFVIWDIVTTKVL